jgi:hypothetical protein
MSPRWFYFHAGQTHGPLSSQEIKALAAQGKIGNSDLVWREGTGPEERLPAEAVLEIQEPAVGELPDWLEDVRKNQSLGPVAPLEPTHDLPEWIEDWQEDLRIHRQSGPVPPPEPMPDPPEWIEDLRLWIALDYSGEKIPWDYTLGNPPLDGPISTDVEQWFPEEKARLEPPVALSKPAPSVPLAEAKKESGPPVEIQKPVPIAKPVLSSPSPEAKKPTAEGIPAKIEIPPSSKPVAPSEASGKTEWVAPEVKPILPVLKKETTVAPADFLADQALEMAGFDPRTGKVVDSARFQTWKKRQARDMPAKTQISNAGLMEVFRRARTEVERWLDQGSSRPLVLDLDLEAIRNHREIQKVLESYAGYGEAFRAKLLRHLEFMAENRNKYYTARPEG